MYPPLKFNFRYFLTTSCSDWIFFSITRYAPIMSSSSDAQLIVRWNRRQHHQQQQQQLHPNHQDPHPGEMLLGRNRSSPSIGIHGGSSPPSNTTLKCQLKRCRCCHHADGEDLSKLVLHIDFDFGDHHGGSRSSCCSAAEDCQTSIASCGK